MPDEIRALVRRIVNTLEDFSGLDRIWKRGVVHSGGPHYRLRGTPGPVSIGEDECHLLGQLIRRFLAHCFIIGNGFGLSGAFISKMMESHSGESVITLDSKVEGDGEACFLAAEHLRHRLECRLLRNKCGFSPQDIDRTVESPVYDLILIDGGHSHPQVTEDFSAVRRLLQDRSIVAWHDYWLPGVSESVAEAQRAGFRCLKLNSSCEMVFGTRDQAVFRAIESMFQDAEEPAPRRRPLAHLRLTRTFLWTTIKHRLAGARRLN